jgi:hypothetical protein
VKAPLISCSQPRNANNQKPERGILPSQQKLGFHLELFPDVHFGPGQNRFAGSPDPADALDVSAFINDDATLPT